MKYILTNNALKPNGHYAQAIEHNGFVFVSGVLPFNQHTGEFVAGTVEVQMREILANLDSILEAAGSASDKVLKTTIFISDMEAWGRVNALYQEHFQKHTPARSIVAVSTLHFGAHLEMEAIAYI